MIGGPLVVALGIIDQHDAFAAIDLNVTFLLAGMMVIASTASHDAVGTAALIRTSRRCWSRRGGSGQLSSTERTS
jgi:Na+/H+ antiporter NhaD/arsenite permease-like protein